MRNPAARVAGGLALLAACFAFGVLVGQRRAGDSVRATSDRQVLSSPSSRTSAPTPQPSSRTEASTSDPATATLQERIRTLESELQTLRETPEKRPSNAGDKELAKRTFKDFVALQIGEVKGPEHLRSVLAGLAQLDPSLVRPFIDCYKKAQTPESTETQKFVAVQLALMSGGADAAEFVNQLLKDSTLDAGLRQRVVGELGGSGLFSIRRLPVGEALGSKAMTLARSEKPDDRRAGVALLGGVTAVGSRLELTRLLTQDPDPGVKAVAIRSLGVVGDPSTHLLLESYATQTSDDPLRKAAAAAIQDLDKGPR